MLNFEELYKKYPRKLGKTKGLEKLRRTIKGQEDYDLFDRAIQNYVRLLEREKTETRFIMHFSTFVSRWQDYADPEVLVAPNPDAKFVDQAKIDDMQRISSNLNEYRQKYGLGGS